MVVAAILKRPPWGQIKKELKAIEAAKVAKQVVAEKGATRARAQIEAEHVATIKEFDDDQTGRLNELRGDPAALAKWLTRVSS